jgi:hypothetical protein
LLGTRPICREALETCITLEITAVVALDKIFLPTMNSGPVDVENVMLAHCVNDPSRHLGDMATQLRAVDFVAEASCLPQMAISG